MHQATVAQLLDLNRTFYREFAAAFGASRSVADPAIRWILPHVPPAATILDVACGNGRLALLLDVERPGSTYLGLDASLELVERARGHARHLTSTQVDFAVRDVTQPAWMRGLGVRRFDCVVALALLHHVPSAALRSQLMRDLATLAGSSGRVLVSTWQFLGSERLRRKIVPWNEVGLAREDVDPGDYLLDWKRGGRGIRYCHLVDDQELRRLAMAAGLRVAHMARTGGREGNLSLAAVLEPASSG